MTFQKNKIFLLRILDSECSNECIDFTMMSVFFMCLLSPFGTVKMLRFSTLGMVSGSKLILVDTANIDFLIFKLFIDLIRFIF